MFRTAGRCIEALNTVTAARPDAVAGATIAVLAVAVVADLARLALDHAVAAKVTLHAAVKGLAVGVIALFGSGLDDPVAAARLVTA